MIDCHAHISSDVFDPDRERVLERAQQAGVNAIIAMSENLDDSRRVLQLGRDYPGVLLPCIGIHPDNFGDDRQVPTDEDIAEITFMIRENRKALIGIGEVGLDYWVARSKDHRLKQRAFLRQMAEMANELSLPLSVHCRSAGRYTLDLLAECGTQKVMMHAFDGKAGHALALESDSPALGPDPALRNEPANLVLVVQNIADIKKETAETVRLATTRNAKSLFGPALASSLLRQVHV